MTQEQIDHEEIAKKHTKNVLSELKALMKKYKFEIKATDRWTGFAECGEDIGIEILFDSEEWWLKDIEFNDFIDCQAISQNNIPNFRNN